MKLLLATGNAHKVTEISDLLRDVPHLEIVSLNDFPHVEMPEETGSTMQENARIKALHCLRETGLPSLADDSGVESMHSMVNRACIRRVGSKVVIMTAWLPCCNV
jgi:XTP/dITP diphosphohydrolase